MGEVCIYYETDGLGNGKKILLNAEDGAFVNNAVEMSNISEKYAPPGRHLLSAVALTGLDLPDEDLYRRGIEDLSRWYPGADFRPLAVYRIPYGQFAQPPGIHGRLPENRTQTPGAHPGRRVHRGCFHKRLHAFGRKGRGGGDRVSDSTVFRRSRSRTSGRPIPTGFWRSVGFR